MSQTNERAFETYVEEILLTRSTVATSRPKPLTSTSP